MISILLYTQHLAWYFSLPGVWLWLNAILKISPKPAQLLLWMRLGKTSLAFSCLILERNRPIGVNRREFLARKCMYARCVWRPDPLDKLERNYMCNWGPWVLATRIPCSPQLFCCQLIAVSATAISPRHCFPIRQKILPGQYIWECFDSWNSNKKFTNFKA